MKYFFLCCCLLLQVVTKAQLLYPYKDTVHRYTIGIPEKWRYWIRNDGTPIKLLVYGTDKDSTKRIADNFNLSIIDQPGIDVDSAFQLVAYFTSQTRLQVQDTGSYMVNGKRMLWFDDVHLSESRKDTLCASDFVVYHDSKVYVITCTTTPSRMSNSRELFHRVAQTFKVALPPMYETLKIDFPTDRKWKIQSETDDSTMHFMQVLPTNETAEHWTNVINFITFKGRIAQSIDETLLSYKAQIKEGDKGAKFTQLSKGDNWVLFKVESNHLPAAATLYYVLQTNSAVHTVSITVSQLTLSDDIAKEWADIFRKGKLVTE